jgi:hypothetical protein
MDDAAWSTKVANLAVDALIQAQLLPAADFERAKQIVAEEVLVRLCLGDRPTDEPSTAVDP